MRALDHVRDTIFGPSLTTKVIHPQAEKRHERFLHAVEITCRVGLIGFAAYCAPVTFAISFSIGAIIGGAYTLAIVFKKFSWSNVKNVMPACAQNFMEYLSGTKFPAVVARVVTAVFIGAHIRHDPVFFVPFCSIFLGFWVGKDAIHAMANLGGHKFNQPNCHKCCS